MTFAATNISLKFVTLRPIKIHLPDFSWRPAATKPPTPTGRAAEAAAAPPAADRTARRGRAPWRRPSRRARGGRPGWRASTATTTRWRTPWPRRPRRRAASASPRPCPGERRPTTSSPCPASAQLQRLRAAWAGGPHSGPHRRSRPAHPAQTRGRPLLRPPRRIAGPGGGDRTCKSNTFFAILSYLCRQLVIWEDDSILIAKLSKY